MKAFHSIMFVALFIFSGCQTMNRVPQSVSVTNEASEKFSDPATVEAFTDDLLKELTRQVRKTSRRVLVYHYGSRELGRLDLKRGQNRTEEYSSPVELEPAEAAAYFREWSAQFQSGNSESEIGPGFYAAIDPVQSEGYAGKNWFLMELTIPTGMNYLDIRLGNSILLTQDFVTKWLEAEDIQKLRAQKLGSKYFNVYFATLLQHEGLAPIFKQALLKLKVDAIVYDWRKSAFKICSRKGGLPDAAFNFINPEFLAGTAAPKIFVQNLEADVSGTKRAAYSRLYNLIVAAPLSFHVEQLQDSAHINGVSAVQTSLNPPRWHSSYAKIRTLTHPWANILGKANPLRTLFKFPAEADKLFVKTVNEVSDTDGPMGYELIPDLLTLVTEVSGQYTSSTYRYDPLVAMKKETPAEYEKLVGRIKDQTFDCSEK